jgi:hypothetical protein
MKKIPIKKELSFIYFRDRVTLRRLTWRRKSSASGGVGLTTLCATHVSNIKIISRKFFIKTLSLEIYKVLLPKVSLSVKLLL